MRKTMLVVALIDRPSHCGPASGYIVLSLTNEVHVPSIINGVYSHPD